jgi:hypothetical protein
MTCSMTQLDAIIAACGGCKPRPSRRKSIVLAEISPNLAAPGMTYQVQFKGQDFTDSKGRVAHLRGITIEASVVLNLDATNGPVPAMGSHELRRLWQNLRLQGKGNHVYLENLDGRDILDDGWARQLRNRNARPLAPDFNALAEAGASPGLLGYPMPDQTSVGFGSPTLAALTRTDTVDITTDVWFGTPGESPTHGLIPMFELAANGELRITFGATAIPAAAVGVGSRIPASYTVPETGGSVAVRIWAHLVYLDGVVVDPQWRLDSYQVDVLKGSLKYMDTITRYAALRNHSEEAPLVAVDSLSSSALSCDIAGNQEIAGLSADRMRSRLMELLIDTEMSELADFNRSVALPAFEPAAAGTNFGPGNRKRLIDFLVPYSKRRGISPAGPVNYNFSGWSPTFTFQRVLHRVLLCQDMNRAKEAAAKAYGSLAACRVTGVDDSGAPCAASSNTTLVITKAG